MRPIAEILEESGFSDYLAEVLLLARGYAKEHGEKPSDEGTLIVFFGDDPLSPRFFIDDGIVAEHIADQVKPPKARASTAAEFRIVEESRKRLFESLEWKAVHRRLNTMQLALIKGEDVELPETTDGKPPLALFTYQPNKERGGIDTDLFDTNILMWDSYFLRIGKAMREQRRPTAEVFHDRPTRDHVFFTARLARDLRPAFWDHTGGRVVTMKRDGYEVPAIVIDRGDHGTFMLAGEGIGKGGTLYRTRTAPVFRSVFAMTQEQGTTAPAFTLSRLMSGIDRNFSDRKEQERTLGDLEALVRTTVTVTDREGHFDIIPLGIAFGDTRKEYDGERIYYFEISARAFPAETAFAVEDRPFNTKQGELFLKLPVSAPWTKRRAGVRGYEPAALAWIEEQCVKARGWKKPPSPITLRRLLIEEIGVPREQIEGKGSRGRLYWIRFVEKVVRKAQDAEIPARLDWKPPENFPPDVPTDAGPLGVKGPWKKKALSWRVVLAFAVDGVQSPGRIDEGSVVRWDKTFRRCYGDDVAEGAFSFFRAIASVYHGAGEVTVEEVSSVQSALYHAAYLIAGKRASDPLDQVRTIWVACAGDVASFRYRIGRRVREMRKNADRDEKALLDFILNTPLVAGKGEKEPPPPSVEEVSVEEWKRRAAVSLKDPGAVERLEERIEEALRWLGRDDLREPLWSRLVTRHEKREEGWKGAPHEELEALFALYWNNDNKSGFLDALALGSS